MRGLSGLSARSRPTVVPRAECDPSSVSLRPTPSPTRGEGTWRFGPMNSTSHPTVPREGAVTLPARPESLPINPRETALIVVDMQNAYASPGGYLDLAGFDIEGSAAVIDRIALAVDAARKAGVTVV